MADRLNSGMEFPARERGGSKRIFRVFLVTVSLTLLCLILHTGSAVELSFDDFGFDDLRDAEYTLAEVKLSTVREYGGVLFVKTYEKRYAKLSLSHAGGTGYQQLWIHEGVVYDPSGEVHKTIKDVLIYILQAFDVDEGEVTSKGADLYFDIEGRSGAKIKALNEALLALPTEENLSKHFGKLILHSTPSSAHVFIDNIYRGRTPLALWIREGIHQLMLVKSGYRTLKRTIEVTAGQTKELTGELELEMLPQLSLKWVYKTEGLITSSPTLGDLDNDSKLEVVIGSYDGMIYALNHDGELLWSFDTGDSVNSSPALGDLDGDGKLEVIVGSHSGYVYALTSEGRLRWKYKTTDEVRSSPTLTDINKDSRKEVIIASADGHVYALSANGSLLWEHKTKGKIYSSPAVADVNGDGALEIVIGSNTIYNSIEIVNSLGVPLQYFDWLPVTASSPTLGDLDGDGKVEIILGSSRTNAIYALNLDRIIWEYKTKNDIDSSPVLADIDGDGQLEVVIGSDDGNVYVLSATGELEWMYPTDLDVNSSAVVGDINGDGEQEILIGSFDRMLYVLNSKGEALWVYRMEKMISSSPALGDLDGDGKLEVVIGSQDFGVYALELPGKGEIKWACFRGNPWHTGNLQDALSYAEAVERGPWITSLWAVIGEAATENQPPIAKFSFAPEQPTDLDEIQFIDQSEDPDGKLVEWQWDFGDGFTSSDRNPTHRYQDNGIYEVTLTVTDDGGAIAAATQTVHVANVIPKATFDLFPPHPVINLPVTFDATASSDPDGIIKEYNWDFGDGSTAQGSIVTHVFTTAGTYIVGLTIIDDDDASASVEQEVQVLESGGGGGPAADSLIAAFTYSPNKPLVGQPVTFDASPSFDPNGVIVQYEWDFDDGFTDSGRVVTHAFAEAGTYTVRLTVTNSDGASASVEKEVKVLESGGGGGPA